MGLEDMGHIQHLSYLTSCIVEDVYKQYVLDNILQNTL